MKAEDLILEELVRFARGKVDIKGRRLVLHDLNALGQFRRDIMEMVGPEQARRIFTRFGYFWGQADAAAMKRIFKWDNTLEWLKAGPVLHSLQGLAETEVTRLEVDETAGRCHVECIWRNSGEAQVYMDEVGKASEPCCWIQTGYGSGFASFCLDKSVYFVEQACSACGDDHCMVVGKDVDSWGAEIEPHIPFFQAVDIQGKIKKLTHQLQKKDAELARQKEKLEEVLHKFRIASLEVKSKRYQQVLDLAERVAKFNSSVLITGETGVGKEVLARHIHGLSPRSKGSFVAINCAALTESLLESELFGHKAGSFTGATRDQVGLFEEARAGTIFLDEIAETTQNLQLKFLRVLQEKEVLRVGETRPRKVDVRVMAATNRNLEKAVGDGSFREDLYYRLQVFHIEIPTLRERQEDILPLARNFVEKYAASFGLKNLTIDPLCFDHLLSYPWPGNIRELENCIEHAAVLCSDKVILPKDLPAHITRASKAPEDSQLLDRSLADVELEYIRRILEWTKGNRKKAAEILKIGPATLYRKLNTMKNKGGSDDP